MQNATPKAEEVKTTRHDRLKAREGISANFLLLSDIEMSAALGISRSTWWRGVRAGRFPKPRNPSAGCTRWTLAELQEVIETAAVPSKHVNHRNQR